MNVLHLRFSLVASLMDPWGLLMQTCWPPLSDHWSVQSPSPHLSGFVFYGCLKALWACLRYDRITIVWSLWCNQQSIVMSSAELKPREWDTETLCEDHRFSSFMDSVCCLWNKIMYGLSWGTVYVLTQVSFGCSFPFLPSNLGNKHQNNPLVRA